MKSHYLRYVAAMLMTLIALTNSSYSFAESDYATDKSWYFGLGITASDLSINATNLSQLNSGNTSTTFTTTGSAFKLFTGYKFDPILSIEAGLTSFGEVVMSTDTSKKNLFNSDSLYLAAIATRPISDSIHAFGKLGMSLWSLYNNNEDVIESGQGLIYGMGLDINLYGSKERTLLFEWEHYNFSGVALKSANSIGASISFKF